MQEQEIKARSNISVIPYDENNEMLKEKVTEARVAEYFREICHGKVTRYELTNPCAELCPRQDTRRRWLQDRWRWTNMEDTRYGTA